MVRWSEFITSGSWNVSVTSGSQVIHSGSYSIGTDLSSGADYSVFGPRGITGPTAIVGFAGPTVPPEKINPTLNRNFYDKIKEILNLALRFDPSHDMVMEISEILSEYENSGVLTKEDMILLNKMYKLLVFEAKYHPDRETTVGKINELLRGLDHD